MDKQKGSQARMVQQPASTGLKDLLQQYAGFNVWANQRILAAVGELQGENIDAEITSSFPSIFKTLLHIHDAEAIWWQRLKLEEHIARPSDTFSGNFEELEKKLLQQSALFEDWVKAATEYQLQHVFGYIRNKEQVKQQVMQMLLHLFNHNSFHRGQVVTMLRQLGIEKIPNTDFNGFLFHRK